jgi:hypothetical protein
MNERRDPSSPFGVKLWFDRGEIDDICEDSLTARGCFPQIPAPIEVETFIEKQFGCAVEYVDLGTAILGFTQFASTGAVSRMGASSVLFEGGKSGGRRARATLAHEAGHGLLHALLFINPPRSDLFPEGMYDAGKRQIMCRAEDLSAGYNGRWWEFQANQAIGGLLLPKRLVRQALAPFIENTGQLGQARIVEAQREAAVLKVAEIFEVNPVVARIRVSELCPSAGAQMEL